MENDIVHIDFVVYNEYVLGLFDGIPSEGVPDGHTSDYGTNVTLLCLQVEYLFCLPTLKLICEHNMSGRNLPELEI